MTPLIWYLSYGTAVESLLHSGFWTNSECSLCVTCGVPAEPPWQMWLYVRGTRCVALTKTRGRRFGADRVRGALRVRVLSSLIDLGRTLILPRAESCLTA